MNVWQHLYLSFCKLRFQLSRLQLPIEPIVYDTKLQLGEQTDFYERYLITRELRGYRLWHVSFSILKPLSVEKKQLFDNKLAAVLAARAENYCAIRAVQVLLSRKNVRPVFGKLELKIIAKAVAETDGLDNFSELGYTWPGYVEYKTTHGTRCLNVEEPEACLFEVTKNGGGFAKAVKLPYMVNLYSNYSDEYPEGALVVCTSNEEAKAGYASAVPLSEPPPYIEDLGMLDTEYAAMLLEEDCSLAGFSVEEDDETQQADWSLVAEAVAEVDRNRVSELLLLIHSLQGKPLETSLSELFLEWQIELEQLIAVEQ